MKISPTLQQFTESQNVIEVSGGTVAKCLDNLIRQFPDIKKRLFDKDGNLLALVLIGTETIQGKDLNKSVVDGDGLSLITVLGGG